MSSYVESAADHDFTAFLARVSHHKTAVIRELTTSFTKPETERATFLAEKQTTEVRIEVERVKAAPRFLVVVEPAVSVDRQLEIAVGVLERQESGRRKAA